MNKLPSNCFNLFQWHLKKNGMSVAVAGKGRMSTTTENSTRVGLVISSTDSIRTFLSGASNNPTLSLELRQSSSDLLRQSDVPYAPLRAVWIASDPSTRPELTRLFSGTRFVFSSPKPREKVKPLVSITLFRFPNFSAFKIWSWSCFFIHENHFQFLFLFFFWFQYYCCWDIDWFWFGKKWYMK